MKPSYKILFVLAAIPLFAGVGCVVQKNAAGGSSKAHAYKVLCYQDSMHPWVKSGQPGKCTICAMDLTPIYQDDKGFQEGGDMVARSSNNLPVLNVQSEEMKP